MNQHNTKVYYQPSTQSKEASGGAILREVLRSYYKKSAPYLSQPGLDAAYFSGYVTWVAQYACKGKRVLDIGCGTGLSSRLLRQNGFQVTGVDISSALLARARSQEDGQVEYISADAIDLPFKNASFDVIGSMSCLEHIPDAEAALGEMMRVLKPGGFILIMAPNLCSPLLALMVLLRICFKAKGMHGFASTPREAMRLFFTNVSISVKKKLHKEAQFLYRSPDLLYFCGGDADSVYLSCQIDLKKFFTHHQWEVVAYATNQGKRSCWAKIIAMIFPDFCGSCSIVVRKP